MSSNTIKCSGCNNAIQGKEFLNCNICKHRYDLQCAGITPQRFKTMTQEAKRWKCPECVSRMPKSDNTNTPLRTPQPPVSESKVEVDPDEQSCNITIRSKPKCQAKEIKDQGSDYVTEATLRAVIKQELAGTIKSTIKDLFSEQMSSFKLQVSEFQNSLTFFNKTFDDLKNENNKLKKIQSTLSGELKTVKNENSCLKQSLTSVESRVKQLEEEHVRQQQWSRLQNIELVGVPEKSQNTQENTAEVAMRLIEHIGVHVKPEDIEFAHRVQPRRPSSVKKGRAIVVRLKQRAIKDQIVATARKRRSVTAKDIGLGDDADKIFVNEHLTRENKSLLASCKLKARETGFKYVWTKNCRIFIRKNDTSPPMLISSVLDLEKIA